MRPEHLLAAALGMLRARPPAGLSVTDVEGFAARHRARLLELIHAAFKDSNPPQPDPAARGAALPPQLPPASRAALERLRLLLIRLRWAPFEVAAILAFQHAQAGRWPEATASLTASGLPPADLTWLQRGDIEALSARLRDGLALSLVADSWPEQLAPRTERLLQQVLPLLREVEQAAGVSSPRSPRLDTALRVAQGITSPEEVVEAEPAFDLPLDDDLPELSPLPGTFTAWAGRKGEALSREALTEGQRVVTEQGEHGEITRIYRYLLQSLTSGQQDSVTRVELKLDSGRDAVAAGDLFAELEPPRRVVSDLQVNGHWLSPRAAWERALAAFHASERYAERALDARKPATRAQWQRHAQEERAAFQTLFRALSIWRETWPQQEIPGLDPLWWRRLELESRPSPKEDERWELAWLRRVPDDWATRLQPGDAVILHVLGPYGRQPEHGWRIHALQGHHAILARDHQRRTEPLWMLKPV